MDGRRVVGLAATTADDLETRGRWVTGLVGEEWCAGGASVLGAGEVTAGDTGGKVIFHHTPWSPAGMGRDHLFPEHTLPFHLG